MSEENIEVARREPTWALVTFDMQVCDWIARLAKCIPNADTEAIREEALEARESLEKIAEYKYGKKSL